MVINKYMIIKYYYVGFYSWLLVWLYNITIYLMNDDDDEGEWKMKDGWVE